MQNWIQQTNVTEQPDGYKKQAFSRQKGVIPALLIRSHLGPTEILPFKTLQSYPALTLIPTLTPSLKSCIPFPNILKRLSASHTL